MTQTEINKLKSLIAKASNEELNVVREAHSRRTSVLRNQVKSGLTIGDTVSLVHRKFGGKVVGEVLKIKRTKADVILNGTVYNVPMGMLTREVA
jgi:hypothetical protein